MSVNLPWSEVALRLALTVLAGILIGYNRQEQGKAAGMRTTVLVCLAASVAMIQVNLLLPTSGRGPGSFVMNDLMRLPLGILTGVGFIGGGAILRRDNVVVGVTTAATLWLVTVIGLCLGAGEIALGSVATVIGLGALWASPWVERRLLQEHRARIAMELAADGPGEEDIRRYLHEAGMTIVGNDIEIRLAEQHRTMHLDVLRVRRIRDNDTPAAIERLAGIPGVRSLHWTE